MKTFNESDHTEVIQAADEAGIDTILLSLETDSAFDTFAEAAACLKENSSFCDLKIVSEKSCNFNLG